MRTDKITIIVDRVSNTVKYDHELSHPTNDEITTNLTGEATAFLKTRGINMAKAIDYELNPLDENSRTHALNRKVQNLREYINFLLEESSLFLLIDDHAIMYMKLLSELHKVIGNI